jgi:CxxC motif-containing protein
MSKDKDTSMKTSPDTAEPTIRHLTCIACPIGCQLQVTYALAKDDTMGQSTQLAQESIFDSFQVQGNKCPRGEVYAREEISAPKRMLTTTVKVLGSELTTRVPVRSSQSVPVELIPDLLFQLHRLELTAPLELGQEILVIPGSQDSAGASQKVSRQSAANQGHRISILTSHSVKVR